MNDTFDLDHHAREFVLEVRNIIDHWQGRPRIADLGTGSTRARLMGFASDMIRLLDSADDRGWDVRDLAFQLVVGSDGEEHDEGRVDVILASPFEDDLDPQFDTALCHNLEPDDVARPVHDDAQCVGGESAATESTNR